MEIAEKEITPLEMYLLIRTGEGILLEFQKFLNEAGGKKQVYRTKVASKRVLYVCFHHTPFSFMVSRNGLIISDGHRKRYLDSLD
ncbi:MAG: hypothetical protein Q8R55_03485 [Candidatus Taylorbacteria bacterium]|nr:hypothetical protein [Candidatus Taylorbacteria bacterium]